VRESACKIYGDPLKGFPACVIRVVGRGMAVVTNSPAVGCVGECGAAGGHKQLPDDVVVLVFLVVVPRHSTQIHRCTPSLELVISHVMTPTLGDIDLPEVGILVLREQLVCGCLSEPRPSHHVSRHRPA